MKKNERNFENALKKTLLFLGKYFMIPMITLITIGWIYIFSNSEKVSQNFPYPISSSIYDSALSPQINLAQVLLYGVRDQWNLPSISISVGYKGELIWSEAVGYSDLKAHKPVSLETTYRIGSISKSLTAVSLMRLIQEKNISIDDTVQLLTPALLSDKQPITIKQIASHTSGFRHYNYGPSYFYKELIERKQYSSVEESINGFINEPLLFNPGTQFLYSTNGYSVLARFMEEFSGESYQNLMNELLLDNLNLDSTILEDTDTNNRTNRATFYLKAPFDSYLEAPEVNNSSKWAGGGFLSTPSDLAKFGNALLSGQILTKPLLETLFTPVALSDGSMNPQYYAIGWRSDVTSLTVNDIKKPYRTVHHGGTSAGSMGFLLLFPDEQLVIAMTTNTIPDETASLRGRMYSVARIFLSDH